MEVHGGLAAHGQYLYLHVSLPLYPFLRLFCVPRGDSFGK